MTIAETFPNGLRNLQVEGAIRLHQGRHILIADQPGAGKTAQLEVALELDGQFEDPAARILITAPKTACQLMWARELTARVGGQYDVVIADLTGNLGNHRRRKTAASMAERNTYLGQKMVEASQRQRPLIVLTNFDGVFWKFGGAAKLPNLWQNRWSAIVIDESHLVLPTTADDPKKYTQFWYGLSQLVTTANPLRFSVSGTPDNGKLENRYGHYRFLYPNRFSSYWGWVRYFFETKSNGWGGLDIKWLKPERQAEWDAFQSQIMIRRTKAEMLKGLPPKQWINVEIPLTESQRIRYDEYEAEALEELAAAEPDKQQSMMLTLGFRLRQLAVTDWFSVEGKWKAKGGLEDSSTLAWLVEWLTERGHHEKSRDDSLGKVVITGYLVEELEWLSRELNLLGFGEVPVLSGQTHAANKSYLEQEFQRGDLRILLFSGHIGVSISLDAADDMIFVDTVHDPDKVEQTEDRIHRASSSGVKTFWRIIPEDTVMEEIIHANDSRYRVTRKSYDGSRGANFRREIIKVKGEAA